MRTRAAIAPSARVIDTESGDTMATEKRCSTSYLIFGASLRHGSLNDRLASLAATVVNEKGGTVDRVQMSDFDCPSYHIDVDNGTCIPAGDRSLTSGPG